MDKTRVGNGEGSMGDINESDNIVKKSEDIDGDLLVRKLDTSKKFNQAVSENPAKLSNQRFVIFQLYQ